MKCKHIWDQIDNNPKFLYIVQGYRCLQCNKRKIKYKLTIPSYSLIITIILYFIIWFIILRYILKI